MFRIYAHAVLMVAVLGMSAARPAVGSEPPPAASIHLQHSYRFERDGWIYVHLEGSPEQIGFQHGSLLSREIADILRVIKPYLEKSTRRDWSFYRQASEKMLWSGIDLEYQREIDGIVAGLNAKGVEVDRWDLVALNANQELPYYYVPWLDKKEGKPAITHAPGNCSAFIASGSYTKDGKIVMGHNAWTNYVLGFCAAGMWFSTHQADQGVAAFIMDGLPGVIASDDDFGVNSAGIIVHRDNDHAVRRGLGPRRGKPGVRACSQARCNTAVRSTTSCGLCSTATTAATPTIG